MANLISKPNYLRSYKSLEIPAVDRFNSKLFYESINISDPDNTIALDKLQKARTPVLFYDTFRRKVVDIPFLPEEVGLNEPVFLNNSLVMNKASDTKIFNDFNSIPLVSIELFTPIFKFLLDTWADDEKSRGEKGLSPLISNQFYLYSDIDSTGKIEIFPVQIDFKRDCYKYYWVAFAPMLNYYSPEHNLGRLIYSM